MCSILQPDWSLLLQGSLHCKQGSLQETLFYNFQWYVEQNLYPPHLYKGENDVKLHVPSLQCKLICPCCY